MGGNLTKARAMSDGSRQNQRGSSSASGSRQNQRGSSSASGSRQNQRGSSSASGSRQDQRGSSSADDHVLPDGTTVRIRQVSRDDGGRLLAMWDRLSQETIRNRFLGGFTLTENNVSKFTHLDPERQHALVATLGSGESERIVGVVRYDRFEDRPTAAEFAALVEDAHQGRGIGTALLRHLISAARAEGIERLVGEVYADNRRMHRLLDHLGLTFERTPQGITVHTSFRLEPTEQFLDAVAADEKAAAVAALRRFLRPESAAVVGASRDPLSIGGLVFRNILQGGFSGVVYPVNASAPVVQSVRAYPSLSDLPEVPDLVVVSVPAQHVASVVDEAGTLGVRAVCIITAGFAEAGPDGAKLQAEMLDLARGHGMRVVGPNCMGLLNASAAYRLNATFSTTFPEPGRLGFLSQSGALGLAVLHHAADLGLGLSTFVSVGNKADISGNDLLLFWEDDPETDVALLYLESFGNPRRFARLARRISYRKPIVAVKSGRTTAGQRAASSHTAALAAGDVAVDALFRQTGVIRTDSLEELFGVAGLLSSQPLPRGKRVAILTNAGGPGILCADACESNGLEVPALSEATKARLREFLPPEAGFDNPVDMIASGTAEQYGEALRVLGNAEDVDAVIVIFIPPVVTEAADVASELVAARRDVPSDRTILSVFMGARGVPPELAAASIPSYAFPEDAARTLGRVAEYAHWRSSPHGSVVVPDDTDPERARALAADAIERGGGWLETGTAEEILLAYGVQFARSEIVATPEEAAEVQERIGTPVAIKLAAAIHKSDVGGIRLGVSSAEEADRTVKEIRAELDERGLGQYGERFVVQEMIEDGVEMVVGVTHDPSFGPLLLAGFGGTLVELLQDVSIRITPVTDEDVEEMLRTLRAYPLLTGYRGSPPTDVEALKDLLHRINALVEDVPEVAELDLNPVFVRESEAMAVDVRMRLEP
jgi:acetate---CoA ligase (ADP-forming)